MSLDETSREEEASKTRYVSQERRMSGARSTCSLHLANDIRIFAFFLVSIFIVPDTPRQSTRPVSTFQLVGTCPEKIGERSGAPCLGALHFVGRRERLGVPSSTGFSRLASQLIFGTRCVTDMYYESARAWESRAVTAVTEASREYSCNVLK